MLMFIALGTLGGRSGKPHNDDYIRGVACEPEYTNQATSQGDDNFVLDPT